MSSHSMLLKSNSAPTYHMNDSPKNMHSIFSRLIPSCLHSYVTYIRICICTYIYTYIHICIYICTYMYLYIYVYTYVYIYICVYIHILICIYIRVYTYVYIYIHTYIPVNLRIYVYVYVHMHTYYSIKYQTRGTKLFSFLSFARQISNLIPGLSGW